MRLARKLANLETIVSARADETPADRYWTPERIELWRQWVIRLLETMPEPRAVVAYVELTTLPSELWGPVTRRLHAMACAGADGRYDCTGWPHWADRAIALPEPVCEALEAYPDASFKIDYSCEDCGLEVPHLPYAGPALLAVCPLCGGAVKHCGYTHRRLRDTSERQRAEMADPGDPA